VTALVTVLPPRTAKALADPRGTGEYELALKQTEKVVQKSSTLNLRISTPYPTQPTSLTILRRSRIVVNENMAKI
jgi:hypothetical protein